MRALQARHAAAVVMVAALGCGPPPRSVVGTDAGQGEAGAALPAGLRPPDLARKLAIFLWEAEPDAAFLQQVEAAPPASRDDVRRLATTMLGDPRARFMVASFFSVWLELDTVGTRMKDPTQYPEFTPELEADMVEEATRLGTYVTFDGDGRFPTLFTASFSFVNDRLAALYDVASPPGGAFALTPLDAAQRSGVLTLAGVLANQAGPTEPLPSDRGAFVSGLLCEVVPPGPAGLQFMEPPANESMRDWVLGFAPPCAACHQALDPLGLALGNYDGLGRYRTMERGFAIDASGTWKPADGSMPVTFDGARALSTIIAGRAEARDCFVRKWLAFAAGADQGADDLSVAQARDAFVAANLDIRALIAAVTTTDAFLAP